MDLEQQKRQLTRNAFGPDAVEKQILLLKLVDLFERRPILPEKYDMNPDSEHRLWIAQVRALMNRLDKIHWGTSFDSTVHTMASFWQLGLSPALQVVGDAIEMLKLDLELDGRGEIGTAYAPGEVYRFFADLKSIISASQTSLLIIDPYFDGAAFDQYLSSASSTLQIDILADRYAKDVKNYAQKFGAQNGVTIGLRTSSQLHDRVVIIDRQDCWVMGGSIKDAGKKPTYLIPLAPSVAMAKIAIYDQIWASAAVA